MKRFVCISLFLTSIFPHAGIADEPLLLLFDGETGAEFAGCLNCSPLDDASVCNRYGDFGSRYSDLSIWNRYGRFGSKYEENSPWSRYGSGLRIVDEQGNYYGLFTASRYNRSKIPIVTALVEANESMGDLPALRDLYCE
jgi:hypothetical protein